MRTYHFWCFKKDGSRVEESLTAENDREFLSSLPGHLAKKNLRVDEQALVTWRIEGTLSLKKQPGLGWELSPETRRELEEIESVRRCRPFRNF